jgi:hypothetical protein
MATVHILLMTWGPSLLFMLSNVISCACRFKQIPAQQMRERETFVGYTCEHPQYCKVWSML